MESETVRIGRNRLLGVFRYLEALNEHRTRDDLPWSLLNVVGLEPPPTEEDNFRHFVAFVFRFAG